jgi:hypothetical protein
LAQIARKQAPFDTISGVAQFVMNQAVLRAVLADSTLTDATPDGITLASFRDSMMQTTNTGLVEKSAISLAADNQVAAIDYLQAINPKNCADNYHKIVNSIFARTWADTIFYFSPEDSTTLMNIALQDPLTCGTAIYDARIMMGINVNDFSTDGAQSSSRLSANNNQQANDINTWQGVMYPNPTTNEAWYETTLKKGDKGIISISDLLGRELLSQPLTEGANKLHFDITNLVGGVYLYKVMVNDKPVQNSKLVIQR